MASSTNHFSLLLLLTLLSSSLLHATHSRESQFFNKVSATNNLVPQTKQPPNTQPDFVPENENGYGLYDRSSAQLPPSATTESNQPLPKYLPKNYNPVAYVTQPEDNTFAQDKSFTTSNPYDNNNNYYNGGAQNYYNNNNNNKREFDEESASYRSYPATRNNNYYYDEPQGRLSDTSFRGGATVSSREEYFNNDFEPQGMSDTRLLENGKYFYDVNMEKYSSSHPYERLRARRNGFNNNNGINSENAYVFNDGNGYQNRDDQFQDEGNDLPWGKYEMRLH